MSQEKKKTKLRKKLGTDKVLGSFFNGVEILLLSCLSERLRISTTLPVFLWVSDLVCHIKERMQILCMKSGCWLTEPARSSE
jgi:hypothetical protein